MAQSLYNALVHFFLDFHPQFKTNAFYIAGESYAGMASLPKHLAFSPI